MVRIKSINSRCNMSTNIYTTKELAEKLELNVRTIREMLFNDELKGYKKKGKWYVLHADLVQWLRS